MFKAIGISLAAYVCYAVFTGRIYAKSGISARVVERGESPGYYWVVVGIYAALSASLVTIF